MCVNVWGQVTTSMRILWVLKISFSMKKKGRVVDDDGDDAESFEDDNFAPLPPKKGRRRHREPGFAYVLFQALLGIIVVLCMFTALIVGLELMGFPRWADWWINHIVRFAVGQIRMNALTTGRVLYLVSIGGLLASIWLSCLCCCRCCFNETANEWFALLSLIGGCFLACAAYFGPYTTVTTTQYVASLAWSMTGGLIFG
jgi:hypothetical protein